MISDRTMVHAINSTVPARRDVKEATGRDAAHVRENRKKLVPLTDAEVELVNEIRKSKGLGPIFQYGVKY